MQRQAPMGNSQLDSTQATNHKNSNEDAPIDMNDFPQLISHQNSSEVAVRNQVPSTSSVVQRSQEFHIQNEDFPALPGFKGNASPENAVVYTKSRHFPMGRSAGFALAGPYASYHQQQEPLHRHHQQASPGTLTSTAGRGSFVMPNAANLLQLRGSDMSPFPLGVPGSYHSQIIPCLQSVGPNTTMALGSYDQLTHRYQQHHYQSQFQRQFLATGQSSREQGIKLMQGFQAAPDRFGILGLVRGARKFDPDFITLASGIDLAALGLNVNAEDKLYKTFSSPWSDRPATGEPEYILPKCYAQESPRLQQAHFASFPKETLFYIFYSMPKDEAQLYAANELHKRGWFYHRELHLWLTRLQHVEGLIKTNTYEQGCYIYFDPSTWKTAAGKFVLQYEMLEKRPQLPNINRTK